MGKNSDNGNQKNEEKQVNYFASFNTAQNANLSAYDAFLESYSNPFRIETTRTRDRAAFKKRILGIDITEINRTEDAKIAQFNNTIRAMHERQTAYILYEIAARAGRKPEEVPKYLQEIQAARETAKAANAQNPSERQRDAFKAAVQQLSVKVGDDGKELLDAQGKNVTVSEEEIEQIAKDSALEENIRKAESDYLHLDPPEEPDLDECRDAVEYRAMNNYVKTEERGAYRDYLAGTVLQCTGYEKGDLGAKFFADCFSDDHIHTEIYYDELAKARRQWVTDRMHELPEDERTEEAFARECEKLDAALNSYVFPKMGVQPEHKAFNDMNEQEYYQFALDNVPPTTLARKIKADFQNYTANQMLREENRGDRIQKAAAYIKYLEDLHSRRPLGTRFADYFRRDGEDSTIKYMKRMILGGGYTSRELRNAIETTPFKYENGRIAQRFDDLSNKKIVPQLKEVETAVEKFDADFDGLYQESITVKEKVATELLEKEPEKETNKNPDRQKTAEKEEEIKRAPNNEVGKEEEIERVPKNATATTEPLIPQTDALPPKKQNPCATNVTHWRAFAAMIEKPPFISHSATTDKLDVQQELFNIKNNVKRENAERAFKDYNDRVLETQSKQIPYILKELCKLANRPVTDADKYLSSPEPMTSARFTEAFEELRIKVDNEGRKLNTKSEVLNEQNMGPFKEHALVVDEKDIRRILLESTYEENIGGIEENFDALIKDNDQSSQRQERYKAALTDSVLKETGYTKEFLDSVFQYGFAGRGIPIAENFQKSRQACIRDRMNRLPEDQRTEEAFVEECEKLDRAIRVYLLPKNGVAANDPDVFSVPKNQQEYDKFALECISPTAMGRNIEAKFNECIQAENMIETGEALGYIQRLESLHNRRSMGQRFKDFFNFSKSESSTISRMKKQLNQKIGKSEVDNFKKKNYDIYYEAKTIDQRFRDLRDGKMIPLQDSIAAETEAVLDQSDRLERQTEQLRQAVKENQDLQKTEELQADKNPDGRVTLFGKDLEETTKEVQSK